MQKVIPPGLNYADIKPEAIENQIRIVKFTPIATIQQAQPNDIVRFHLQGNGFFDPYSAYVRIRVQIDDLPDVSLGDDGRTNGGQFAGKFLDRSAHSLFSRLVIRSQGTELERIEQYDVMAAMVNDIIYSQEQRLLHHYEGFAHKVGAQATECQIDKVAGLADNDHEDVFQYLPYLYANAGSTNFSHFGDQGVWKMAINCATDDNKYLSTNDDPTTLSLTKSGSIPPLLRMISGQLNPTLPIGVQKYGQPVTLQDMIQFEGVSGTNKKAGGIKMIGQGNPATDGAVNDADLNIIRTQIAVQNGQPNNNDIGCKIISPTELEFCIPIYSGIIGVLMPEKKLIPMSLLPLEVEFTMNPHAFYPVGVNVTNRRYTVKRFEIWSHTLFFEQELHRSLEAIVAESGIFIHYNSFYLTPINTYSATPGNISEYNQLGLYLKSINAVHWAFLYSSFENDNGPRKLHFVSHNMTQLQLRNGMDLIPSEPILAQTGGNTFTGISNQHAPVLVEMYKAWNKMHDPMTDGAITSFNYNLDNVLTKPNFIKDWFAQQKVVGRCQYGLSLEGEELGQNKTIITGKKSVMPFDINIRAYKSQAQVSYMFCFLRADFIIYVRPDLVVTRLGL